MLTEKYYNKNENKVTFTRQQASNFAKQIADDFNPLHNIDSRRFCVPGDLLFALVLSRYGCSKQMHFTFSGMVTDEVTLNMPEYSSQLSVKGDNGKEYLSIGQSGENSSDSTLIDNIIRQYVAFSGQTFPHILIPIMKEKGVMINFTRPMVMYQSMVIDLERLDLCNIKLELDKERTVFEVNGKRGNVCLAFNLIADEQFVGRGEKYMLASGLKPFDESDIAKVITDYAQRKKDFKA